MRSGDATTEMIGGSHCGLGEVTKSQDWAPRGVSDGTHSKIFRCNQTRVVRMGAQGSLEEITKITGLGTRWSLRWDPFEDFRAQSNACGARGSHRIPHRQTMAPDAAVRQGQDGTNIFNQSKTPSSRGT
jgi:hypothetical protein